VLDVEFSHGAEIRTIHPAILRSAEDTVLVDCGYPGFLPRLERAAAACGASMEEVSSVLVTHHDYDHCGALHEIRRKYPAIRVIASEGDAPHIRGDLPSLRLLQAEALYDTLEGEREREDARDFQAALRAVPPADVDLTVRDGDAFPWCGGARIVATPGHMPGHISVYLERLRTLITGDALIAINGRLRIANPHYALDLDAAKESVRRLAAMDISTFVCYHGGVVRGDLSHRRYRHLLR